jgi:hypothetical protein
MNACAIAAVRGNLDYSAIAAAGIIEARMVPWLMAAAISGAADFHCPTICLEG